MRLPAQATTLIGRDRDVDRASAALVDPTCRLLTVLGTAGVGKTRLALAAAESVAHRFADGACFVDLTQITDAADLPSLLALELDMQMDDGTVMERLKRSLAEREMLLL